MVEVDPLELSLKVVNLWDKQWLLLTSGTIDNCNMMTVSWGSIGCIWHLPFVQVVVRPQRYTYQYIEKSDSFTVSAFPEKHRKALELLGTLSGRDGNKLGKTDLTLKESCRVSAPSYNEASLILECRKIYYQDLDPAGFIDNRIQKNYPENDYHRAYFGEILTAFIRE